MLMLILFLSIATKVSFAQQNNSVKGHLVMTPKSFKKLVEKNFDYAFIQANQYVYPELSSFSSLDPFDENGYEGSCIVLFFTDQNGKAISPEAAGFMGASFPEPQALTPVTPSIQIHDVENQHALVIQLRSIGTNIREKEGIMLRIKQTGVADHEIGFNYASFPYSYSAAPEIWEGAYERNNSESKEAIAHMMFDASRDPMYLSILPQFKYEEQAIPLKPDEGGDGFILEGSMSMPFTIVKGRDDQRRFYRTSAIFIDPEFTWRITKNASSSPLLPLNTKLGIGVYRSFILGEYSLKANDDADTLKFEKGRFHTLSLVLEGKHYSNGQDSGAYYYPNFATNPTIKRHDYRGGNFSTNYFQFDVLYNSIDKNLRHLSGSLSYRGDGQLPGAEFEVDQNNRFGRSRVLGMFMFKGPLARGKRPLRFAGHDTQDYGEISVPRMTQHTFKLDLELVLGNMEAYNPGGSERRLSSRLRYINNPVDHRSVGYFVQGYVGRDYLNIRYNLWTYSILAGITFEFNRYNPANRYLKRRLQSIEEYYQNNSYKSPTK